jgi:nucleoid-associated protein EbfC
MMKGNIAQMMQKAQRMQENMQKVQEELAQMEVTGQAGGGAVKITLTGKFEARKVNIDPAVLADAEMLEDLMVAAINDAVGKANEESSRRMAAVTAGMPLPPGLKLPF